MSNPTMTPTEQDRQAADALRARMPCVKHCGVCGSDIARALATARAEGFRAGREAAANAVDDVWVPFEESGREALADALAAIRALPTEGDERG